MGAEAVIITSAANRFYFSGFSGSAGYLFVTMDRAVLVTDSRYAIQAARQAPEYALTVSSETDLTPLGKSLSSIVFEDVYMPVAEYRRLEAAGAALVPAGDRLDLLRRVKDAHEVCKIKEALRLACEAFSYLCGELRVGMSETEAAALLEGYMRRQGAQKPSFSTICASGERSALPHGVATDKQIQRGDFLVMDYGCIVDGYCSDITRTVVFGQPDGKQLQIYNTVLEAQKRAKEELKAGVAAASVDGAARGIIAGAGFEKFFGHSLGHGVGIQVHEAPYLSPKSKEKLEAGNIVTIEPGIYIEGFGGVRIEDMALITQAGHETLTTAQRELVVI